MGAFNYKTGIGTPNPLDAPPEMPIDSPFAEQYGQQHQDFYGSLANAEAANMEAYRQQERAKIDNMQLQAQRDAAMTALNQMANQKQMQQQADTMLMGQQLGLARSMFDMASSPLKGLFS